MEYITVKYKIHLDLVDNPENEKLFTLTLLEKVKEVYDRILEQLTPIDIRFRRRDQDNEIQKLITVHVKCSISERKPTTTFDVDDLINKALKSGKL